MTPKHCFLFCFLFIAPLQIISVCSSPWLTLPPKPYGDGIDYEAIGFCVSQGEGWASHFGNSEWRSPYLKADSFQYASLMSKPGPVVPDTNRPPLLPTWIATVYTILPRGPVAFAAIRLSFAISLAIGCSLIASFGFLVVSSSRSNAIRQIGPWVGLAVVAITYSERNLRNYLTDFLTEPFALLLMGVFLLSLWKASQRQTKLNILSSAISFSMLIYCRTSFLLWLPFLIAVLPVLFAWTGESNRFIWKQPLQWTLLFLMAVLLTQSPWWIRNCSVLEQFQPLGTKGSTTLLGGYCDESVARQGEWQFDAERKLRTQYPPPVESEQARAWINNELDIAKKAGDQVREWISSNLTVLPKLMVQRVVTEWNPYSGKALLLKLLAAIGCVALAIRDRHALLWIAFPLVIQSIVTALTYSVGGRFLVPVYGCLYLLALIGFAEGCRLAWRSYSICFSVESPIKRNLAEHQGPPEVAPPELTPSVPDPPAETPAGRGGPD